MTAINARNRTLDLLRVIGIFFVMIIHSPIHGDVKSHPLIFFFEDFLARGVDPVFFMLSGYFAAHKINLSSCNFSSYLHEKTKTLIIPYLFWNLLVIVLVLGVKLLGFNSAVQGAGSYFDLKFTFSSISSALFGIGRAPIVFQFWWFRDLIVVSLAAFVICRYLPKSLLLPWFLFFLPIPMAGSLGYYLLGYYLNESLPPEKFPSFKSSLVYCASWILMGIGTVIGSVSIPFPLQQLGSAAFLFMAAIIASRASLASSIATIGPAVFFVYATHEPLQTIMSKMWQAFKIPAYGSFFSFLLIPVTVLTVCVVMYNLLRAIAPRLMAFATGGR